MGARVFSVLINSDAALLNYTLPSIQSPIIKEFYIPAPHSAATPKLNITFIRGPIGDPMINAISITPADTLYPWLPLSVGNMTGNGSWERVAGLDCGAVADWGPDSVGRYWVSDLPYLVNPNNTVIFEYGLGVTTGQVSDIVKYLLILTWILLLTYSPNKTLRQCHITFFNLVKSCSSEWV